MKTSENSGKYEIVRLFREAIPEEMSQSYGHFPTGGGGVVAQPNSIEFGGVFLISQQLFLWNCQMDDFP